MKNGKGSADNKYIGKLCSDESKSQIRKHDLYNWKINISKTKIMKTERKKK